MNSAFLMAIGRHDGGNLVENVDEMLSAAIKDVVRYGQKATVTVTMTITPPKQSREDRGGAGPLEELLTEQFERLCDSIAVDCPGIPIHRGVGGAQP